MGVEHGQLSEMTFARLYREVFQTGLHSTHSILTGMGRAMEKNSAIRAVIGLSKYARTPNRYLSSWRQR